MGEGNKRNTVSDLGGELELQKLTLLWLEDYEGIVDHFRVLLEDAGFEVHAESESYRAIDWLKQGGKPDIIMSDMRNSAFVLDTMLAENSSIPGLDTVSASRRRVDSGHSLREFLLADEELREIPFVVLTAGTSYDHEYEALKVARQHILIKSHFMSKDTSLLPQTLTWLMQQQFKYEPPELIRVVSQELKQLKQSTTKPILKARVKIIEKATPSIWRRIIDLIRQWGNP